MTVLELTSTKEKEFTVPMRLKSAMVKILRIHNSSTPIKPQNVEDMDLGQVLDHLKAEDENIVRDIIAVLHEVYNTDEYLKKDATELSELEKSIKDLEESLKSQKALLAKRKLNHEKRLKESIEAKEERAKRNTIRVLCPQADDVSASGSAASAFGSPLKKQLRVVSDLADGAPESASKKSAKIGETEIREFDKATKSDAEEEESDAVESPKKKAW